ncbi:YjbH domain-containing protein [Falsihalocynthiibacter sp. SS001]|uniref:YjbH domain-containing protein n=1 Tax=Falsihalocynthiibacter sp. SS001 TaxID=3349698 RepID=UPI0036D31B24
MSGKNYKKRPYLKMAMMGSTSCVCAATLALAFPSAASDASYNMFGIPGLIDTPSGESMPDAELGMTASHFAGSTRVSSSFQITDRLSAVFRYTRIADWNTADYDTYYDRSIDFRYQVLEESQYVPAVSIGIMDVAGTGIYSSEYIAATKNFTPKIRATVGLGWGRLGSYNSIGSPFGDRPELDVGEGGTFNVDQYFRGPMAMFGGVEYRATEKLTLKAEYSSDAYTLETDDKGLFEHKSPFNFGIQYDINDFISVGGYSLYGSELAASITLNFNPKKPVVLGSFGPAPLAVKPRPVFSDDPEMYGTVWLNEPGAQEILAENLRKALEYDGVEMEAVAMRGTSIEVRIRNNKYTSAAQAVGRTARALTRTMPPSVETFNIMLMVNGMATSNTKLKRSDVETFVSQPNGEAQIMSRAVIEDAVPTKPANLIYPAGVYPEFEWSIDPYADFSLFDPDDPVRWGIGLRPSMHYYAAPGLEISGSINAQIIGTLGNDTTPSNSKVQPVRSDANLYDAFSPVSLQYLNASYFFQPGEEIYGRVTAGYLERMFGGVSTEILWKPVDKRYALGAELNYVKQRATDSYVGFQDYETATGHITAYYEDVAGFDFQLSAGQYLAGDIGGTFQVRREFANGWRVGAYATLTDLTDEEFGEGSFDKGVILEVPQTWLTGKPTRKSEAIVLQPLSRDGGARLEVNDRLYDRIRVNHVEALKTGQGRFWR